MIFDISTEAYNLSGLSDCCTQEVATPGYCGTTQFEPFRNTCILGGYAFSGTEVLNSTISGVSCAIDSSWIGGIIPTSQADCNNVFNLGVDAIFVPAVSGGYVSSGNCLLKVTSDSSCGCPNSIQTTQSVDLCDLAASAFNQLNPDSLNLFNSNCS